MFNRCLASNLHVSKETNSSVSTRQGKYCIKNRLLKGYRELHRDTDTIDFSFPFPGISVFVLERKPSVRKQYFCMLHMDSR